MRFAIEWRVEEGFGFRFLGGGGRDRMGAGIVECVVRAENRKFENDR
jgi:hypothetical protein